MQLNVFFTSAEMAPVETSANDIYIIVDVIRATTTMAVMLDQGAARILAAPSIEQAREAGQKLHGSLLCGERRVKRIPGFDYGNSPTEFSQLDLTGREMILTTTNGTRAFYACPEDSTRLAGSFYNAQAVSSLALELAWQRNSNIAIVCAGEFNYFALDDAVCAGYLAIELELQHDDRLTAQEFSSPLHLHESALGAIELYHACYPRKVLEYSNSATSVIEAGLGPDTEFCMQRSVSKSIPMVIGRNEETGLLEIGQAQSI